MFKRVEKRQRKLEEEEGLGLDEEMKEIMGIQDTDSEESESDTDNEENGAENSQEELDDDAKANSNDNSKAEEEEEEEKEEDPEVSVSNALVDPVYVVSLDPDVNACIICPGKLLKGASMVQAHRISKAHQRRFKQFKLVATNAEEKESAWAVLKRHSEEKPKLSLATSSSGSSKRAEKKKVHLERQKARREKIKQSKAKKATKKAVGASITASLPESSKTDAQKTRKSKDEHHTSTATTSETPPKKKRKISSLDLDLTANRPQERPTSPIQPAYQVPLGNSKKSITDIVRSTTKRALRLGHGRNQQLKSPK